MNRTALIVLAAAAVIAAVFFGMRMFAAPPADLDLSRSKPTTKGTYIVAIAPEAEPLQQGPLHAWVLTLTTPDGKAVEGATIGMDGGMPQHGHGLPTSPAVSAYLGEGRYRVDGVRFNMAGWWELKFAIDAAAGKDNVVFNVRL